MNEKKDDQGTGMSCPITRRDFLNGVAIGAGAIASSGWLAALSDEFAPEKAPGYYPPGLTGMRGNHEGTYTYAHKLRDGESWESMGAAEKTGEAYDLVVVGGGISGLAAAHFYRKAAGAGARILILDNHDDFGGHAKRNEFNAGGRTLLSYGGTQSIESPARYSEVAKGLLKELGIETQQFYKAYDQQLYGSLKLGTGVFFDRETFGEDRLVAGMGRLPWPEFLAKAPLSEAARRDIAKVYTEKVDYLAGMTREQKRAKLAKTSYSDFLTKIVRLNPQILPFFQSFTHDLWCVGIEAVAALDCYEAGDDYGDLMYPGFQGMDLGSEEKTEPYIFHFPDGNASIARMLVRRLVADSLPGSTMDDIVLARAHYAQLDQAGASVRIRLNSTAVRVQHAGPASSREVEIAYMRGGKLKTVQAKSCVLACYNMMIPYICPELPDKQKESLSSLVKAPLVYTHVAIRNWTAFQKLGVRQIMAPASYHNYVALDFPVSLGGYRFPSHPDEPMVLFMLRTPCQPGLSQRDQYRAGRYELMQTPFEKFERNIREQLGRMLGSGGFDPARDIDAITVNRWAHGYAYTYDSLSDPEWAEGEQPWVLGRKRFGQIAIANSDAGASAYTDCAIDQAHRAVTDLLSANG
ncbi:MAG TPA: NAD(P)-binding protein [Candidatus Sulfotelmatobacter sp.]|jgi:spermidine dehydrogenase